MRSCPCGPRRWRLLSPVGPVGVLRMRSAGAAAAAAEGGLRFRERRCRTQRLRRAAVAVVDGCGGGRWGWWRRLGAASRTCLVRRCCGARRQCPASARPARAEVPRGGEPPVRVVSRICFVGELYLFHCTHISYFLTCKPQLWKPTTGFLQSNAAHPVAERHGGRRRLHVPGRQSMVLNRSGHRGWGTTVKWLSGLSLCVCVRTCFVGCPKDRPPLPTESTPQIVPTGLSAPPSRAHTDAHALAPNRITHQIKTHLSKAKIKSKTCQR